mgnify:CR=1 FL=1
MFVTLSDRETALEFWAEAETWWIQCDARVGHLRYRFRWLSLKWIMARRVPPGTPPTAEVPLWHYDPHWRRFDYECWVLNPNREANDVDEDDPALRDPSDPGPTGVVWRDGGHCLKGLRGLSRATSLGCTI